MDEEEEFEKRMQRLYKVVGLFQDEEYLKNVFEEEEKALLFLDKLKEHIKVRGCNIPIYQIRLFKKILKIFPNAKIECHIPHTKRWADILVPSYKIVIEHDGLNAHKYSEKKDRKRDLELNKLGYKVLHYQGYLPTDEELRDDLKFMVRNVVPVKYKKFGEDITKDIVKENELVIV